jgi:hypothetical protein
MLLSKGKYRHKAKITLGIRGGCASSFLGWILDEPEIHLGDHEISIDLSVLR